MNLELKRDVFIEATPETVYSYLTEQEKVAQWFAAIVEVDARPGGIFKCGESEEFAVQGEYLETVPYEKVVFTWGGVHGLEPGATTVEITLKEQDNGTRLYLRHYNVSTQEMADSFGHGWPNRAFPLLKLVAEGGSTNDRCITSGPCE